MVSHWNMDEEIFGDPVIQVVASPAMATLGAFDPSELPGINLGEAWDLLASPFDQMPENDTTCPFLAMSGGFSRQTHPFTVANYLSSTSPLSFPWGEDLADTVSVPSGDLFLRAFFLPTVSNLPVGMFWKIDGLTKDVMIKSVKALSPSTASPYAPFIYILDSLSERLKDWISAATSHALLFETKAFAYETIEAQFPSLVTGSVPETIICTATFAPMMDMRYL